MTASVTPIPEPTSPTEVVVGKLADKPEPKPGLYDKYRVTHADGSPVGGEFFVLKMTDPATVPALQAYAAATDNEKLAADLRERFGDPAQYDLTDEQVEAALDAFNDEEFFNQRTRMRAALVAALAKRAELEGRA